METPITKPINHLNYPDNKGRVYCRQHNSIKKFVPEDCFNCPLYSGSIQGEGVECYYIDLQSRNNTMLALPVPDPQQQLLRISDLLDKGILPTEPLDTEE